MFLFFGYIFDGFTVDPKLEAGKVETQLSPEAEFAACWGDCQWIGIFLEPSFPKPVPCVEWNRPHPAFCSS
eukprot:2346729-Amphidinium_carterae.1